MAQKVNTIPFVSAIILAAGSSTRMLPHHKLALPVDGKPMLLRTVDYVLAAELSEVIVVLGHAADELNFLPDKRLQIVHNQDFHTGMASSIRCGMQHISARSDAVLIALGDMPFIEPTTVRLMCESAQNLRIPTILRPAYLGQAGHPVLFSQHFFADLMLLNGDCGALSIIQKNQSVLREIDCDDAGVVIDIDTPEALQRIKGRFFRNGNK